MRSWISFAAFAACCVAAAAAAKEDAKVDKVAAPLLSPYSQDSEHFWNRLHRALFVRTSADGNQHVHSTDPLLYRGGVFLLEGESHRRAITILDEFLAAPSDRVTGELLKQLVFQRDLWAAFDYAAWYPDDWVNHSRHEPAAIALRTRLAKALGSLALDDSELAALPDNYALAVKAKEFAADHDPERPERPFLPADLFDAAGPWVRFHEATAEPMTRRHFEGAGGRAAHVVFLRLPKGRAATEQYLKELGSDPVQQFPPGTMVAMVRRGLAVDRGAKVRMTPLTELVQLRVYRRIPDDPRANLHGDFGEQDVYEFKLDRASFFTGKHGLRAIGPDEPAEPFERGGPDPFEPPARRAEQRPASKPVPSLKTCISCHQAPGVHSVNSMERALRSPVKGRSDLFPTYNWDVEKKFTVRTKIRQYDWGLLQGLLEAKREGATDRGTP